MLGYRPRIPEKETKTGDVMSLFCIAVYTYDFLFWRDLFDDPASFFIEPIRQGEINDTRILLVYKFQPAEMLLIVCFLRYEHAYSSYRPCDVNFN